MAKANEQGWGLGMVLKVVIALCGFCAAVLVGIQNGRLDKVESRQDSHEKVPVHAVGAEKLKAQGDRITAQQTVTDGKIDRLANEVAKNGKTLDSLAPEVMRQGIILERQEVLLQRIDESLRK